ncbi:MAG: glutamine--fructose-6-phosphate transaminase (isomerizing) [Verrucomicrobiota bacterium]|nr:glutamine--fructose-6-phosphate transaminase (isomerizing) [Verrucomicrobiota bacterium]
MCGIYGYIGKKDPLQMCLGGLEQLEYRGYDSTGIAGVVSGQIAFCKKAGKLSNLKRELRFKYLELAIGHTRWATHGAVNDENAHPHLDVTQSIAVVHNGIIENYEGLREQLKNEGAQFSSQTDTEVIVQLIRKFYQGDLLSAVQQTVPLLRGHLAIAVIHKNHPEQIVASARDCPLAIGIAEDNTESIISSDSHAFLGSPFNVLFLRAGEVANVKRGTIDVYDSECKKMAKKTERLESSNYRPPSKEGFEHFMLKEIYEQPAVLEKIFSHSPFEKFKITSDELKRFNRVWLIGCGTSAHAGSIAATYFEELAHLPAICDIASEARYRIPLLAPDTLVIAISQSGETADTLAALREVQAHGSKVIAVCNVKNSTMVREADASLLLEAGPEISVCSTKAFTSEIALFLLFAIHMAHLRKTNIEQCQEVLSQLRHVPTYIQQVIDKASQLHRLANKYCRYEDFFFMGRRYMHTTCLEAALKLKEISYVNANGYPAGELKHGPIALIDAHFPVVVFCANEQTQDKIISNLTEVKARGAPILAFAPENMEGVTSIADDVFWLPPTIDPIAPFASITAGQLLAYYIAKERGSDIDQPRNLAKSVTVE